MSEPTYGSESKTKIVRISIGFLADLLKSGERRFTVENGLPEDASVVGYLAPNTPLESWTLAVVIHSETFPVRMAHELLRSLDAPTVRIGSEATEPSATTATATEGEGGSDETQKA